MTALVNPTTTPGNEQLIFLLNHHLSAIHDVIWHTMKARIHAVRGVLRSAGLLYEPNTNINVPRDLYWARIAGYHTSRFSAVDGRWFVTRTDGTEAPRRHEIPQEFVHASAPECRERARAILNAARHCTCSSTALPLKDAEAR